jgi:hypothetical protein
VSDHRSRGRSLTATRPEYPLEREYEGVAAVVDAVAAAGTRVDVYGHSHRGIVAFGAATLTGWPVPDPFVYALPADVEERMDELLARGDRDGVVEAALSSSTCRATVATTSRLGNAVSRAPPMVTTPRRSRWPVVALLFRSLEDMSDEDMTAIRITLGNSTVCDGRAHRHDRPGLPLANKSFNQSYAGSDPLERRQGQPEGHGEDDNDG